MSSVGEVAGVQPTGPRDEATRVHEERVAFVLEMARALHAYGTPAHRLEETLTLVADQLGLEGQFFSTPTSIFSSFGPLVTQRTHLLRVEPGAPDLGRLGRVDEVMQEVIARRLSPAEGVREIQAIERAPDRFAGPARVVAYGLASGAAAIFFGGNLRGWAVAALLGVLVGLVERLAVRHRAWNRVETPLAAFTAGAVATLLGITWGGFSVSTAILSGLIVLLPGMMLTTAMTELSTRHLASGTARLTGAFSVFLGLGFGVALGTRLIVAVLGPAPLVATPDLPWYWGWIAVVISSVSYLALLKAEPRDFPGIVLAGALALAGSRAGSAFFGPELGVMLGALTVGLGANLYARFAGRPATIPTVPGVLILVPGSVGFRSVADLLDREVITGVETAFRMILMAVALAAGLLLARVISPERRMR
ncbi:MAG: threonine/serine exporter family protein [Candidatus Eisenbacteria bacterium]|nr:threonine/serine exporter family protein [Candidatus Eisenbacteria bacterium]